MNPLFSILSEGDFLLQGFSSLIWWYAISRISRLLGKIHGLMIRRRIGGYKDRIGYKGKPLHFVLLHYIERKCIKYVNVVCGVHGSMGASKPQQGICHERINGRDTIWRGVWSIPHTGKIQVNLWEKDWKILIWDGDISWRSWIKYCWASLAKISRFFILNINWDQTSFIFAFDDD